MKDKSKYEFDVAFSFTQRDEGLAFQINDLIQDRFKTFIYSEQQKKLVGADGETIFNEVFCEKSRLVVILFRNDWGKTPWTRIEENAIRNRGHEEGYDFTTFVNLEKDALMPKWLPKNRIYYDFERWGIKGLAPVIETRVEEAGGQGRPESVVDRADRLKRQRIAEQSRDIFLSSLELRTTAHKEVTIIFNELKKYKIEIEDPKTNLILAFEDKPHEMYEFGYNGFFLCFFWNGLNCYDIRESNLRVTLYQRSGMKHFDYKEKIIKQSDYKIDADILLNLGWSEYGSAKKFMTTVELIEKWVKLFIDRLSKESL